MKLGPVPAASTDAVHRIMAANRGKDTGLEKRLRQGLRVSGARGGRAHFRINNTRVDLAFPSHRVALQVHGCFWHHCAVCNLPIPKTNRDYWQRKFLINQVRDERLRLEIKRAGWRLVEIWEHEVDEDVQACSKRVVKALEAQASALTVKRSASALLASPSGRGPEAPMEGSL